ALGDISAGSRTLSLHMREDGLWVDKLIVTNDAGYTPDANARLVAGSKRVGDTLPDNLAPGLTIYPNPSTGTVQVVLPEKALVQVHNSLGQLVLERPLAAGRTSLDLSELGRGVHMLSATTVQGQRQVKRLLLE
ncbi:MAG: T9SS type A sorting domain-containing protein, partial [Tunicatimonas sp.]